MRAIEMEKDEKKSQSGLVASSVDGQFCKRFAIKFRYMWSNRDMRRGDNGDRKALLDVPMLR